MTRGVASRALSLRGMRDVATATHSDADEIRRRMAKIRRELHEDIRGVAEAAEAVADWRHYIRTYPWASAGLALAVGYFVVPRRRRSSIKAADVVKAVTEAQAVQAIPAPSAPVQMIAEPPKKAGRGLVGMAFSLVAPIAMRAAQNYATHFVSNWIAQHQQDHLAAMMAAAGMGPPTGDPGPSMPGGPGPQQAQGGWTTGGGGGRF